jgi:hypothetical protein
LFLGQRTEAAAVVDFNRPGIGVYLLTHFDPSGKKTDSVTFKGNGKRIPLEVLPNTGHTLPIPQPP